MLQRKTRGALFLNHCDRSWTPDVARLLASRFGAPCAAERDIAAGVAPRTITSDWAWCFKTPISYWKRYRTPVSAEADYWGTGGAIFGLALFVNLTVLDICRNCLLTDDLGMSQLARRRG